MKTHDLIELLGADRTVAAPVGRSLARVLLPAGLLSLLLLVSWMGLRSGLPAELTGNPRLLFKLAWNAALATVACAALLESARPLPLRAGWWIALLVVGAVLLLAVVAELLLLPASAWQQAAVGRNATWCLRMIPVLSLAPLLAALWAVRQGAPHRPAASGALAGLVAAGMGGLVYALHCPDDSPLFVASWYPLAGALVAAAGALLGARWLRW